MVIQTTAVCMVGLALRKKSIISTKHNYSSSLGWQQVSALQFGGSNILENKVQFCYSVRAVTGMQSTCQQW
jgi:hypothetical protein